MNTCVQVKDTCSLYTDCAIKLRVYIHVHVPLPKLISTTTYMYLHVHADPRSVIDLYLLVFLLM